MNYSDIDRPPKNIDIRARVTAPGSELRDAELGADADELGADAED